MRATGFQGTQNYFPTLSFFLREKLSARWPNQPGRNVLTGGQLAQCLALSDTCLTMTTTKRINVISFYNLLLRLESIQP